MSKNLMVALGAYLTIMTFSTFSMDKNLEKAVNQQLAEYGFCTVLKTNHVNNEITMTSFSKTINPTAPYHLGILIKPLRVRNLLKKHSTCSMNIKETFNSAA